MAEEIASLYATIGADISGALDGFNKVSKEMDKLGDGFKKAGTTLTLGVTTPILAFLGTSLKAASDAQTQLAQLNAVIKSTGGAAGVTAKQAVEMAEALQLTTRYSKEQTLSAENLLLTFTNIKNDVFPQATRIVQDMSTALGQDLKSSAIQLGKALQDPIQGITALRRVGVNFTEDQKAQIKALMEQGDLLAAQKIILKELATEFGGSAAAAGKTFAGQMDILNHKFGEFQEKVGVALMPLLQDGMKIAGDFVDALMKIPAPILDLGLKAALAAAALGPLLGIIGNITGAIGLLAGALFPVIIPLGVVVGLFAMYENNTMGVRDRINELGVTLRKAMVTAQQLIIIVGIGLFQAFTFVQNIVKKIEDSIANIIRGLTDALKLTPTLEKLTHGGPEVGGSPVVPGVLHNLPFGIGSILQAAGFAEGGYTGDQSGVAGFVHGGEYVVPKGGALVSGGGPQTLHIVFQAHDFEQHLYYNVGKGIARGNAMAAGG